jgi:hypothetical protein
MPAPPKPLYVVLIPATIPLWIVRLSVFEFPFLPHPVPIPAPTYLVPVLIPVTFPFKIVRLSIRELDPDGAYPVPMPDPPISAFREVSPTTVPPAIVRLVRLDFRSAIPPPIPDDPSQPRPGTEPFAITKWPQE